MHVFWSSSSLFHGCVQQRNIGRVQSICGVLGSCIVSGGHSSGGIIGVLFCSGEVAGESGNLSGSVDSPVKVPARGVSLALLGSDSASQELGMSSNEVNEVGGAIMLVNRAERRMRSRRK